MNDAVDKQIKQIAEGCFDEEMAKRTIDNSLRQSSRKRKLEPISTPNEEYENFHGYKVI